MSAAAPARARPQPGPAARQAAGEIARPARAARPRARRLRAGGVIWIALVAVLFGGIVAVQVTALRANIELGRLNARAGQVRSHNQLLLAELATLENPYRISALARRMGMIRTVPDAADILTLAPSSGARTAHRPALRPPRPPVAAKVPGR